MTDERPAGWELRNAQKMWRPRANEDKDMDADMMFEWRWRRTRHCEFDMGDPHEHCPRCGGVLQFDHPGGQPCPAPDVK